MKKTVLFILCLSTIISVSDGKTQRQEYELDGDTLIQYGLYSGDFSKYGIANAIYYKRK